MFRLFVYPKTILTAETIIDLKSIGQIVIGRKHSRSTADIQIECDFVSRYHCTITLMYEGTHSFYRLRDGMLLGKASTNGTWVNQNLIKEHILTHNDVITFYQNAEYPSVIFKERQDKEIDSTLKYELQQKPYIPCLFPHWCDRGDRI